MFFEKSQDDRLNVRYGRIIGMCLLAIGLALVLLMLTGTDNAEAGTVVPPGPVNDAIYPGGWNNAGSPYWVQGDIIVPSDIATPGVTNRLTIDGFSGPVEVRFNGSYSLTIGEAGSGNPADIMINGLNRNILLSSNLPGNTWEGIEITDVGGGSFIMESIIKRTSAGPDTAIWLNGCSGATIYHNEIREVTGFTQAVGIQLYNETGVLDTDNNIVQWNYIHNVSTILPGPYMASGISLTNASANTIYYNEIETVSSLGGVGSGAFGIHLKDSSFNTITPNYFIRNIQSNGNIVAGIELFGDCDFNTIEVGDINMVEALPGVGEAFGVRLVGDGLAGTAPDNNTIENSNIKNIIPGGSMAYGISVSDATMTYINNNTVINNMNGIYVQKGAYVNLWNNEISDNVLWGIYMDDTSSGNWVVDSNALLANNPARFKGDILVTGGKLSLYNILSSEVRGVSIYPGGLLELGASPASLISQDVWVDGVLYVNSSKWQINCTTSHGQYGIEVNSTGTMIVQDNGTGPSNITDSPYDNDGGTLGTDDFRFHFKAWPGAVFRFLDSELSECGWNGIFSDRGLYIGTTDGIIRGSTIKRNYWGINAVLGNTLIENNIIQDADTLGIYSAGGTWSYIANNTILNSGTNADGIRIQSVGRLAFNNTIDLKGTNVYAIYSSVDDVDIIDNKITTSNSNSHGVFLEWAYNCVIDDNKIFLQNNNQYGIYLKNAHLGQITRNVISGSDIGIYLEGSTNNSIGNNTVYNNNHGLQFITGSTAVLYNNEIYDNNVWGIWMDGSSSGSWIVDSIAILVNNDMQLNGDIQVTGGKLTFYNIQSSEVKGVSIAPGGLLEIGASPNSIISQDVWVDGLLYVNSSKWEINCTTSHGQYGIQVNTTGTMIVQDNGTGPSNITDSPWDNDGGVLGTDDFRYDFSVWGLATLQFLDSELYECGWNGIAWERGLWWQVSDVIVRGNTIKNCYWGMSSSGGNARIENNVFGNIGRYGVWVEGGAPSYVANNSISMSGISMRGIWFQTDGHEGINNTINIQGTFSYAIGCQVSDSMQIIDNKIIISGADSHGIYIYLRSNNSVIDDNRIILQNSNQYGIYVREAHFAQITRNIVSGSDIGISLEDSTGNAIGNNTIYNNSFGIQFTIGSNAILYNNEIYDNGMWGIWMDGSSSGLWIVDDHACLINNPAKFNGGIQVNGGKLTFYNISSSEVGTVAIDTGGLMEIGASPASLISNNVTVDGILYINSSKWEINVSFHGEFGIQVNSTGTMVIQDNGTGPSIITDGPYDVDDNSGGDFRYFFKVLGGSTFRLYDSEVSEVGYSGAFLEFGPYVNTNDAHVRGSQFRRNHYGFIISGGGCTFENNVIEDVYVNGLWVQGPSGCVIMNNNINNTGSGGLGILVRDNGHWVENNTVNTSGNSVHGIYMDSTDDNDILDNKITTTGNSADGIRFASSHANRIYDNTIDASGSNSRGIYVPSDNNQFSNNTIFNAVSGIYLQGSLGTIIGNNTLYDNDNGIYVDGSSSVTFYNNEIFDNMIWGIWMGEGSHAVWIADDYASLINNPVKFNGSVLVTSGKMSFYNIASSYVGMVAIGTNGVMELGVSPASLITQNVWVDGVLYINSSKWEINVSFNGEFGIQVNSTGTLVIQDNGTGPSIITDGPYDIDDNSVGDFRYYFKILAGSTLRLFDSEVYEVGYSGAFSDRGPYVDTNDASVRGCYFIRNHIGFIINSGGWTFENNVIDDVYNMGLWVEGSLGSVVMNNTINTSVNLGYAILLGSNGGHWVENNTINIFDNNAYGIYFSGADDCDALKNTITTNGLDSHGIFLSSSQANRIYDNTIDASGNNARGIYFSTSDGNQGTNNTIFNADPGIQVLDSLGTILGNNTIYNNDIGIYADGSSSIILYNNEIYDNIFWGILMDIGSSGVWYVDSYASLINNDGHFIGPLTVLSTGDMDIEMSTLTIHDISIDSGGVLDVLNSKSTVISWNLTINGITALDNSNWEINNTYEGEHWIQVNPTGTLNMINGSMITAYDPIYRYDFYVAGTATFMDGTIAFCGYNYSTGSAGVQVTEENVSFDNMAFYNCTVGIVVMGVSPSLQNLAFYNCSAAMAFLNSDTLSVTNVTVRNLITQGGSIGALGIYVENYTNLTLIDIDINSSTPDTAGITILDSYGVSIADSLIYNVTHNGIEADNSEVTLDNVDVMLCDDGIRAINGSIMTILDSHVSDSINNGITMEDSAGYVFNTSIIGNSNFGIYLYNSDPTIESCLISDPGQISGVVCNFGSDPLIVNSTLSSIFSDFVAVGDSHPVALNCTFNNSTVDIVEPTSSLEVQWYLHIKVESQFGGIIAGAIVNVTDNTNGTFDESYLSDAGGYVNWITITEYMQYQMSYTFFTPYNISAWKSPDFGQILANISKSMVVVVTLDLGAGTIDYIRLEYLNGVPVAEGTVLTADEELAVYARGYNTTSGLVGDVNVTWSVNGGIGVLSGSTGTWITMNATTVGTGNISATYNTLSNITGNLTIMPGTVVDIYMVPPGPESYTADDSNLYQVFGYDSDGNHNTTWIPQWSWDAIVLGVMTPVTPDLYNYSIDFNVAGSSLVRVNVMGNPLVFNTSAVTVTAGKVVEIIIIPGGAETNTTDEVFNLTVEGYDADGNLNTSWAPDVIWDGPDLGLVSISGYDISIDFSFVGTSNINVSDAIDSRIYNNTKSFTVNPGNPYRLVYVSGRGQTGSSNNPLASPFVVMVEDFNGNPVPGVEINWSLDGWPVGAIGQMLSDYNSLTDVNGEATTILTLGDLGGMYWANATNLTLALVGEPVSFNGTATPYTIDEVLITDQFGIPITDIILSADDTITLYAWGYNITQGITGPLAVNWSSLGGIGVFTTPVIGQTQVTFDPTTVGIGNISAEYQSITNITGDITVVPGAVTDIQITPPGPETYTAGENFIYMALGYDSDGNQNTTWISEWSWDGPDLGIMTQFTPDGYNYSIDFEVAGTSLVRVNVSGNPLVFNTSVVTVVPGKVVSIIIIPSGAETNTTDEVFNLTVEGYDAYGNLNTTWVPDAGWTGSDLGVITVVGYDISIEFTTLGSGDIEIRDSADPAVFNDTKGFSVNPGAPYRILYVSGDSQTGLASSILPAPFVVLVEDFDGNPVPNVEINWSLDGWPVGASGQMLSSYNSMTDVNGEASTTLTLGDLAGTYWINATNVTNTLVGEPVTFTASVTTFNIDEIIITDGSGTPITDITLTADDTLTLYAWAYNYTGGLIGQVAVNWSSFGGIGSFTTSVVLQSQATFDLTTIGVGNITIEFMNATLTLINTTGDITALPGAVVSIVITPSTATGTTDDSQAFSAVGYDADGNENWGWTPTWAWDGLILGSLTPVDTYNYTVDYNTVGIEDIRVSLSINPAIFDTAAITVNPGQLQRIEIVPWPSTTATSDDIGAFSVVGYDADDNENWTWTPVWSWAGSGLGILTPLDDYNYTVPYDTVGTDTIDAEVSGNPSISNSTDVTVTAGQVVSIEITPWPSVSDNVGNTGMFSVIGYDTDDNENWTWLPVWTWDGSGLGILLSIDEYNYSVTYDSAGSDVINVSVGSDPAIHNTTSVTTTALPTVDYIVIMDLPDGVGNIFDAQNFSVGQSAMFYAAGYNLTSGYVMDVEVIWSVSDVENATVDAGPAMSTTFTANLTHGGTVIITATNASLPIISNSTGTLTVLDPTVDFIQIRDAPANGGSIVQTGSYSEGQTETLYAAGYNDTAGYIGEVDVAWESLNPSVGVVSAGSGTSTTFTAGTEAGTTTVTAVYLPGISNDTGIITVSVVAPPLVIDSIKIRDSPGGLGSAVIQITMVAGGRITVYAAGYNTSTGEFVDNVSVTWDVTVGLGTLGSTTGASTMFTATDATGSQITGTLLATSSGMTATMDVTVELSPLAPIGLTVSQRPEGESLLIAWTANIESDIVGYVIFRSTTSGADFTELAMVSDRSNTDYIDTGLTDGTTYYYYIMAFDTNQNYSPTSAEASGVSDRDTDGDNTYNLQDNDDDGDGLSDAEEDNLGTDPLDTDSDDDGHDDLEDKYPLDPNKWEDKTEPDEFPFWIIIIIIIIIIVLILLFLLMKKRKDEEEMPSEEDLEEMEEAEELPEEDVDALSEEGYFDEEGEEASFEDEDSWEEEEVSEDDLVGDEEGELGEERDIVKEKEEDISDEGESELEEDTGLEDLAKEFECPDCGSPISGSMEKCPNCGIEFEFEEEE